MSNILLQKFSKGNIEIAIEGIKAEIAKNAIPSSSFIDEEPWFMERLAHMFLEKLDIPYNDNDHELLDIVKEFLKNFIKVDITVTFAMTEESKREFFTNVKHFVK